jgi:hypothetical protein
MTNPRDVARFDGIGYKAVTIPHDASIVYDQNQPNGSVSRGLAVRMISSTQCGLTVDASPVKGRIERVESDGFAVIQIEGYMRFPGGTGAVWTASQDKPIVGAVGPASAPGYVRPAAVATLAEVAVANGEIQDFSDPTNVLVKF